MGELAAAAPFEDELNGVAATHCFNGRGAIGRAVSGQIMQFIGSLAFGAMALVNLTVFDLVMFAVFRRTRAHR